MNVRTPETIAVVGVLIAALVIGLAVQRRGSGRQAAQTPAATAASRTLSQEACGLLTSKEVAQLAGRPVLTSGAFANDLGESCAYEFATGGPSILITRIQGDWEATRRVFAETPIPGGPADHLWDPLDRESLSKASDGESLRIGFVPKDADLAGGNLEALALSLSRLALPRMTPLTAGAATPPTNTPPAQ